MHIFVYSGKGAVMSKEVMRALRMLKLDYVKFTDKNIAAIQFSKDSVLIFPGGYTEWYVKRLKKYYPKIKKFVRDGGKYIGFCAGAYLAAKKFVVADNANINVKGEGLGITNAKIVRENKARVRGILRETILGKNKLTKSCRKKIHLYYQNGPAMKKGKGVKLFAKYENGLGAISFNRYGKGKVILFGPHVEGHIKRSFDPIAFNPKKEGTLVLLKNAIYF